LAVSAAGNPSLLPAASGEHVATKPKTIKLHIRGNSSDFFINHTDLDATDLFEHPEKSLPPGVRLILFKKAVPNLILLAPFDTLSYSHCAVLHRSVTISKVLVFSPRPETPEPDDRVIVCLVEFTPDNRIILLDGYLTTLREMDQMILCFHQDTMHPPEAVAIALESARAAATKAARVVALEAGRAAPTTHRSVIHSTPTNIRRNQRREAAARLQIATALVAESHEDLSGLTLRYDPKTHKVWVLFDLDQTLLLSTGHCLRSQLHLFHTDFTIQGKLVIDNSNFQHNMMLRPGVHKALHRIMKVANVGVVTAGDLRYGRAAVIAANEQEWAVTNREDDPSLPSVGPLPEVRIPLPHVFSVRPNPGMPLEKSFEDALPFVSLLSKEGKPIPVMGVDDKLEAWNRSSRPNVIKVTPFQPTNNSPDDMLRVADAIERNAASYFGATLAPSDDEDYVSSPVAAAAAAVDDPDIVTHRVFWGVESHHVTQSTSCHLCVTDVEVRP
jgi:hypothetical protein